MAAPAPDPNFTLTTSILSVWTLARICARRILQHRESCVFHSFECMLGIGLSGAFQKGSSESHAVSRGQLSQKTIFPQIWRRPTNVDGFVPTLSAFFGAFWQRPFWFFSWIMWHFSWIMWLYSIWPCSFLLLFLDDVALFLDHLALLGLALQFFASFPG